MKKKCSIPPVCVFCKRSGTGVQFAVFNPRFQPFGTACVDCEKTLPDGTTLPAPAPAPITTADCKTGFATATQLVDLIHPQTGRSLHRNQTLDEIRVRYPGAEVISVEAFCAAKGARQDEPIEWQEITEEKYWDMLEAVPPAAMIGGHFLMGEPMDHHAVSGLSRYSAIIMRDGKYFTSSRPVTLPEFRAILEAERQRKIAA